MKVDFPEAATLRRQILTGRFSLKEPAKQGIESRMRLGTGEEWLHPEFPDGALDLAGMAAGLALCALMA